MKTKQSIRFEIKSIAEDGTFEGWLSPYGAVDHANDVVEPGSYTKTLQEHGNVIPMLWQHDETEPIGELTLEDRTDGLYCKGRLLMELPTAKKAYLLIKARIVKGLSIGFDTIKSNVVAGIRHLKEIKLWEGSIVTFPCASQAVITSVKNRSYHEIKGDFNEEFSEAQLRSAGYQMICALQDALYSVIWSDLNRDEKTTATQTIIEQFTAAYMEYLPAYLDLLAELYGIDSKSWSAARDTKFTRSINHPEIKSTINILSALLTEAGSDTTSQPTAVETKSEPVDHSAATSLIADIRSLIPAA